VSAGDEYGGIAVPEGDPGALQDASRRLVGTAASLEAAAGAMGSIAGGLGWMGPASVAHAALTTAHTATARMAAEGLVVQAGVIADYARTLEEAQRRAERAIDDARDADRRIREAKADIEQAQADQAAARARIEAAQAARAIAESSLATAAFDLVLGDSSAAAAADRAEAEIAAARADLEDAERRERQARRRLEEAEEDRRDAQRRGREAAESVRDARGGLVAAAQSVGLLPVEPGGPASPAFAAAAGLRLAPPPPPPKPPEEDKPWWKDVGDAVTDGAEWTWNQAKQVPGGVVEGVKGVYEGGKFLYEATPTPVNLLLHRERTMERWQQLGDAGEYAVENPGEFAKQMINYEDLAAGRYGEWLGNLAPDAAAAIMTGGAGAVATRSARTAKATAKLAEGQAAVARAERIKASMPTDEYARKKTIATQAGDDGLISISGEKVDRHRAMLVRVGEDPDLLVATPAADVKAAAADYGHDMPTDFRDRSMGGPGMYNAAHAELKILHEEAKRPLGITQEPCGKSCHPAIAKLAQDRGHDILVVHPDGAILYPAKGLPIPDPTPEQFTGVNSRRPGISAGLAGGAVAASAPPGDDGS
jgi:hypothetical protein